jgi:hypothetical protein
MGEARRGNKTLRKKLGTLPSGLTEKNEAVLRAFDDPRILAAFMNLPDQLWQQARRSNSANAFVSLRTALAIDILVHAPERMHNLSAIRFDTHLHWPQGPRKPALLIFRRQEVKNDVDLKRELPAYLADRLLVYRNEIVPRTGCSSPRKGSRGARPQSRSRSEKRFQRYLGMKVTPRINCGTCARKSFSTAIRVPMNLCVRCLATPAKRPP